MLVSRGSAVVWPFASDSNWHDIFVDSMLDGIGGGVGFCIIDRQSRSFNGFFCTRRQAVIWQRCPHRAARGHYQNQREHQGKLRVRKRDGSVELQQLGSGLWSLRAAAAPRGSARYGESSQNGQESSTNLHARALPFSRETANRASLATATTSTEIAALFNAIVDDTILQRCASCVQSLTEQEDRW